MVNRGNSEYTYKKIVLLYKLLSVGKRAKIWSQKLKCCGVIPMEYQRIGENESELWFCPDCLRRELPLIEASFNSSCNNGLDPDDRCASMEGYWKDRRNREEEESLFMCQNHS